LTLNPLSAYLVKPGTFVSLPSKGKYFTEMPEFTADGEIQVQPMNAIAELYLTNPDGLLNNDSIYKVFSYCVPAIKNPKEIVTPDLDVLFIAIRIATYGNEMGITTACPSCEHIDEYQLDLSRILQTMDRTEKKDTVKIGKLVLNLIPYTIETNTRVKEYAMRVAMAASKINNDISADDKIKFHKNLSEIVSDATKQLVGMTAKCIRSVETPDGVITDQAIIEEFVIGLDAPSYNKMRGVIIKISEEVIDRSVKIQCTNCSHEYATEVSFDPANFFDKN
jgi:hypothetical protein